jgi:hypothetical protein
LLTESGLSTTGTAFALNSAEEAGWDAEKYREWYSALETKMTPANSPGDLFEITHTGSHNFRLSGGNEEFWADGLRYDTILESKYIKNPARSPFIEGSEVPDFIRNKIVREVKNEFGRIKSIIDDPKNPLSKVEVITNDTRAQKFFENLMKELDINGKVIIK